MTKKFILLTENMDLHSAQRFKEESRKLNIDFNFINPFNEHLVLSKNSDIDNRFNIDEKTIVFHRTSGIYFDDFDITFSQDLQVYGAKVFNDPDMLIQLRDKQMQSVFFKKNNIKGIPTFSLRGRPTEHTVDLIRNTLKKYLRDNKYILKTTRGNHGIGVNIVNGDDSLNSLIETIWAIKDQKFLIQPYINGDAEYRVLICDGKILGALSRVQKGNEFRKNSGRGEAFFIENSKIPKQVLDEAMKAYLASGCLYSGIDILLKDQEAFVLEINFMPGFKQMEEISKKNIAKELLLAAFTKL